MKGFSIFLGMAVFLAASANADDKKENERVENAGKVITEIIGIPDNIPQGLLDKAKCVVVLPSVVKGAFIVGANYGRGSNEPGARAFTLAPRPSRRPSGRDVTARGARR